MQDAFDVGVIGYGGAGVRSALGTTLAAAVLHPIARIAVTPLSIEERSRFVDAGFGDILEQRRRAPVWVVPRSEGGTPMRAAMCRARELLAPWCDAHPQSYPPTVLHIGNGPPTDGDPEPAAAALRQACHQ